MGEAQEEIRQQSSRLSEMRALQGEAESLRERLSAAQRQSSSLEASSSLVPGLKSQVGMLTKQVLAQALLVMMLRGSTHFKRRVPPDRRQRVDHEQALQAFPDDDGLMNAV